MISLILTGTSGLHFLLQAVLSNSGGMASEQSNQQIALEAIRHNSSNGTLNSLVPIALFAMIAGIVWLGTRQKKARLQMQAEFHKQLLDKFGSGREFAEFLENPASQRFLEGLWSKNVDAREGPLRNGIVLTMLGLALGGLSLMHRGLLVPGVIILALGVGYLISSAVSYRLAKKLVPAREAGPGNALMS